MAIDTSHADAIDSLDHVVQVRDALDAGSWSTVNYLECTGFTRKVGKGGHDTAQLAYRYGINVKQTGAVGLADYAPLAIGEKFVRINVGGGAFFWYGWIKKVTTSRGGEKLSGTLKVAAGEQVFECVGLSWFLDRIQVDGAYHYPNSMIKRAIPFNGGPGGQIDPDYDHRGNRATNDYDDGGTDRPVFDDVTNSAAGGSQEWSIEAVIDYLLHWYQPVDDSSDPYPCEFELDTDARNLLSSADLRPVLRSDRQTVFACLNSLIQPARGLVWWPEYDSGENKVLVKVQSVHVSSYSLPGGGTMLANNNQQSWNFAGDVLVGSPKIVRDYGHQYNTIRVRGARRTATFTASKASATLVNDFLTGGGQEEPLYRAAADSSTGYGALEEREKAKRNDLARRNAKFRNVYNSFRIATAWDGKSSDGSSSGDKEYACPTLNSSEVITGSEPLRLASLRLLNHTQLKVGYDYAADPSSPTQETDFDRTSFRPPFGVLPVDGGKTKWQYVDQLHDASFETGSGDMDRLTAYHLVMHQQGPGFWIKPANGVNHTIAKNHFSSPGNAEPTQYQPELDYDDLRVTLCAEWDAYAEAVYPEGLPVNPLEELVVDAGPMFRFDWLAENTVLDVVDGDLVLAAAGGPLRDDRVALKQLALITHRWYQDERAQLEATIRQFSTAFELGQMVTSIGSGTTEETVNTVVTSIKWDLAKRQSTTVSTSMIELDVRSLV